MLMHELALEIRNHEIDRETAIQLIAIAYAESGLNEAAEGDPLSNYHGYWHQLYAPYASNGHLAFGLFQVFTYWHADKLIFRTKSHHPDAWAEWLKVPANNVSIAIEIYHRQGLEAWSAFKAETHKPFIPAATIAWDAMPPFEPDDPSPMDADEQAVIIRTLTHIKERLELLWGIPGYP